MDTIGADGSKLYDCCVVNDSLAYVVGQIIPDDPVGEAKQASWYNAAIWNGSHWTPEQVPVYFHGRKTYSPAHAVFARDNKDVWYGIYYMVHWTGSKFVQKFPRLPSFENKIWESPDGSKMYALGDYGSISYSSDGGSSWSPIQTGTILPFRDVWGAGGRVLAIASDESGDGQEAVVRLDGAKAARLNAVLPFAKGIGGIWFAPGDEYVIVGSGIYECHDLRESSWRCDPFTWQIGNILYAVRGDAPNSIFIGGRGGSIAHWNGKSWRNYSGIGNAHDDIRAVSVGKNLAVAVGERFYSGVHEYGVIYMGVRRNAAAAAQHRAKENHFASFR